MTTNADWRGPVGDVWAREWRRTDRSFAALAPHLDAAILGAAPDARGTVLDVGCGAGATALALAAARPDLTVIGIDVSAELLDVARERAARAGSANLRFATADLDTELPDFPPLDLIVSRHGVMFAADPVAMFRRLHERANADAALVFSCFRAPALNPWAGDLAAAVTGTPPSAPDGYAPGPFGFANESFVRGALAAAGWSRVEVVSVDYQYVAGQGADPVADAAAFFTRIGPVASAIRAAGGDDAAMRERLAAALAQHRVDDRVVFPAAAWLWSARA